MIAVIGQKQLRIFLHHLINFVLVVSALLPRADDAIIVGRHSDTAGGT